MMHFVYTVISYGLRQFDPLPISLLRQHVDKLWPVLVGMSVASSVIPQAMKHAARRTASTVKVDFDRIRQYTVLEHATIAYFT